jgi:glycosyltransferase involved in cell wall biosynthesis
VTALSRLRIRAAARAHGVLANSPTLAELFAWGSLAAASLPGIGQPARLSRLLTACRRARSGTVRGLLRRRLAPLLAEGGAAACRERRIGWGRYYGDFGDIGRQRALTTSLVLKAPGPDGEKGVLYCSFEYNWMRILAHHDARALLAEYTLVGASSWSPPDFAPLAAFGGISAEPVFIGISNHADVEAYGMMRPTVEPLPILASDWVDPDAYAPRPHAERTIDLLMVAHWGRFKRHWLLWEALRGMRRDLRVVLVGSELPGRTSADLRAEARAFGVRQELELVVNVPAARVAELQCDARASALFSAREGSCVAVVESLFAGSPVAMVEGAHVGSRAYVNERTGVLLRRRGIARGLARFIEESGRYSPRAWAEANTGCHHANARLNSLLREHALRSGRPWTRDTEPMCWRHVPDYVHPAAHARMEGAVEALRQRHGVELVSYQTPRPAPAARGVPA